MRDPVGGDSWPPPKPRLDGGSGIQPAFGARRLSSGELKGSSWGSGEANPMDSSSACEAKPLHVMMSDHMEEGESTPDAGSVSNDIAVRHRRVLGGDGHRPTPFSHLEGRSGMVPTSGGCGASSGEVDPSSGGLERNSQDLGAPLLQGSEVCMVDGEKVDALLRGGKNPVSSWLPGSELVSVDSVGQDSHGGLDGISRIGEGIAQSFSVGDACMASVDAVEKCSALFRNGPVAVNACMDLIDAVVKRSAIIRDGPVGEFQSASRMVPAAVGNGSILSALPGSVGQVVCGSITNVSSPFPQPSDAVYGGTADGLDDGQAMSIDHQVRPQGVWDNAKPCFRNPGMGNSCSTVSANPWFNKAMPWRKPRVVPLPSVENLS